MWYLLLGILVGLFAWIFDGLDVKIRKALVAVSILLIVFFIFWLIDYDLVAMLHRGKA